MRIGIFTAYMPQVVLGKEGLGRYMGNLIKGFVASGNQVTIACPKWTLDTFDDLLQDFQVDNDQVDFVVEKRIPVLWTLFEKKYQKRHPKRGLKYRVYTPIANFFEILLSYLISITSFVTLAVTVFLLGLLGIALLPVVIISLPFLLLYKLVRLIVKKGAFSVGKLLKKILDLIVGYSSSKWANLHVYLVESRDNAVQRRLINKINHINDVDIWYVPALFWPIISNIHKAKVICAPDLVSDDFAAYFADVGGALQQTQSCRATLSQEKYFITYCEYIRKSLVIDGFGKAGSDVIAIPHVNNDMSGYLSPGGKAQLQNDKVLNISEKFAREKIKRAKARCSSVEAGYFKNFDMEGTHYLFYASQVRPHKNILTLVKAFEYLLRKRYVNIKLIMTGNFNVIEQTGIAAYINEHHLEYDVLAFPNVSAQELAALYHCADLVVNPTLYEGGFPFTFGEGMSVGTPSVMGDIPQTRDVVEPYGIAEDMLFDPYDWKSMAERIEYGLKHREELYKKELPLYKELEKRTGDVVAEEYVRAFEHFIELDKEKEKKKAEATAALTC